MLERQNILFFLPSLPAWVTLEKPEPQFPFWETMVWSSTVLFWGYPKFRPKSISQVVLKVSGLYFRQVGQLLCLSLPSSKIKSFMGLPSWVLAGGRQRCRGCHHHHFPPRCCQSHRGARQSPARQPLWHPTDLQIPFSSLPPCQPHIS
jgi:hypothetical protein